MLSFLLLAALAAEPCTQYANHEVVAPEGYDIANDAIELAEMFANEQRDFAAAIHVICGDNHLAEAEKEGMIEHVLEMQSGSTEAPLDFCNHSTSRDGGIICAGRRDDEEGPELQARFEAVPKSKALAALRKRADDFIDADTHWEVEQYREGTMYAYAETHARLDREKKFVELLERYSKERAPAASAADLKRVDAALNAAYRKVNVNADLRAAQRAWIAYRDAWIAYYQDRWRGAASADALRREIATVITKERTAEFSID